MASLNQVNLALSIWSHREGRDPGEVVEEMALALQGWTVEELAERRQQRE